MTRLADLIINQKVGDKIERKIVEYARFYCGDCGIFGEWIEENSPFDPITGASSALAYHKERFCNAGQGYRKDP